MALKKAFRRFTAPVAELHRDQLRAFCTKVPGVIPIGEAQARHEVTVVGEIQSLRIVPQVDGAPWLEATITDGTGYLVAMWTGRRSIAGVSNGKRMVVSGRGAPNGPGGRLLILNPRYELLSA
jgi:hypothetical protein